MKDMNMRRIMTTKHLVNKCKQDAEGYDYNVGYCNYYFLSPTL